MCTVTTRKLPLTAWTKLACPLGLSTFMVRVQRGVGQICGEFTRSRSALAKNSFSQSLILNATHFFPAEGRAVPKHHWSVPGIWRPYQNRGVKAGSTGAASPPLHPINFRFLPNLSCFQTKSQTFICNLQITLNVNIFKQHVEFIDIVYKKEKETRPKVEIWPSLYFFFVDFFWTDLDP